MLKIFKGENLYNNQHFCMQQLNITTNLRINLGVQIRQDG